MEKSLTAKIPAVHTTTFILKQKQRALKLTTNATWWPIWMCEKPDKILEGRSVDELAQTHSSGSEPPVKH